MRVFIPANLSHTGEGRWDTKDVDSCIAPIVRALNDAGAITVASCCGHGKQPGNIALADGREIIIAPDYETGRRIDSIFPPINCPGCEVLMKLTYGQDKEFEATANFINGLEFLARSYLAMMREADAENADCWTWCDVVIGDVSDASFVEFFSGGDDEKPAGMAGEVRIRVKGTRP